MKTVIPLHQIPQPTRGHEGIARALTKPIKESNAGKFAFKDTSSILLVKCGILGLYRDDGKENGNYYIILGIDWGNMLWNELELRDYLGGITGLCWI